MQKCNFVILWFEDDGADSLKTQIDSGRRTFVICKNFINMKLVQLHGCKVSEALNCKDFVPRSLCRKEILALNNYATLK